MFLRVSNLPLLSYLYLLSVILKKTHISFVLAPVSCRSLSLPILRSALSSPQYVGLYIKLCPSLTSHHLILLSISPPVPSSHCLPLAKHCNNMHVVDHRSILAFTLRYPHPHGPGHMVRPTYSLASCWPGTMGGLCSWLHDPKHFSVRGVGPPKEMDVRKPRTGCSYK